MSPQFSAQFVDIVSSILSVRLKNNEKYIFAISDYMDREETLKYF
ncbi:hypothetical protein [Silvanigrella aquatica]|nr:hypothetical protein [Silvanigrella aquatica]